jgi:SAM-dependent methyltransferase
LTVIKEERKMKESPEDKILQMSRGFMASRILQAGMSTGIISLLARGGKNIRQVSRSTRTTPRGAGILLNALCSIGVARKRGSVYSLTPLGAAGMKMQSMVIHNEQMFRNWGALDDILAKGWDKGHYTSPPTRRGRNNRHFILAMFQRNRGKAPPVMDYIPLKSVKTVIDLGGGPGHWCMSLIRKKPEIRAVVADLPMTLETTRELVKAHGFTGKIETVELDIYGRGKFKLGRKFDLAILSAIIHMAGPEENLELIKKTFNILNPGGMLVVSENVLNEDRVSPANSAIFAVNMLVATRNGRTYTFKEIAGMMRKAGFRIEKMKRLDDRTGFVIGKKPGAA